MGTEYYLVNKETKTFYELGKGSWYSFNHDLEYLTDLECLEEFIFDDCLNGYEEDSKDWKKSYSKEIAVELFDFAKCKNIKNIVLINDCTDDKTIIKCLGFICVGSRYRSDSEPEYNQQSIEAQNSHLNPARAHIYDIRSVLNYSNGSQELVNQFLTILP